MKIPRIPPAGLDFVAALVWLAGAIFFSRSGHPWWALVVLIGAGLFATAGFIRRGESNWPPDSN